MNALPSVYLETWLPIETLGLASSSTVSGIVDRLFFLLIAISLAMLFALAFGISYFLIRYRKGSSASRIPTAYSDRKVEIAWILGTLVVFLAIGVWGSIVYMRIARPPAGKSLDLYVLGRQWMWEVHHPSGRREHNELHIPLGQTVRLNLLSEDVIHSLFLPAFRLKHDVMPHKVTSLWVEATKTGTFPLYCAEFCGTEHHRMRGSVTVMDPVAYAKWSEGGSLDSKLARRGQELFTSYGCTGCHAPGSEIHAPRLEDLFGNRVALASGDFIKADEAYLHDSIMLPNKHVVVGYEPIMPTFQDVISNEETFALIEYIKSISVDNSTEGPAQR